MRKKSYVIPRTREINCILTPILAAHSYLTGGDCPECNDEWPVMPPDPEEDGFSKFN